MRAALKHRLVLFRIAVDTCGLGYTSHNWSYNEDWPWINEGFCGPLWSVNLSNRCCKHLTCDEYTAQFSEILVALEKKIHYLFFQISINLYVSWLGYFFKICFVWDFFFKPWDYISARSSVLSLTVKTVLLDRNIKFATAVSLGKSFKIAYGWWVCKSCLQDYRSWMRN